MINNHPEGTKERRQAERLAYKRFLGTGVEYTNLSFEEFVAGPTKMTTGAR